MSIPTDFSTFQPPTSDYNKFSYPDDSYYNKENCNVHQPKPAQRLPFQSKNTASALAERMEDFSYPSTEDRSIDSDHTTKLDDIAMSPILLKCIGTKECQHVNTVAQRCKYCKDCGIFLPKNGSKAYREETYSEKVTCAPDEVYAVMLESQTKNREYHANAAHLTVRSTMTNWIFQVSQDLKISPDTTCAIISYVDTILCRVEVSKENLQLVILSCLILATKFLESDGKVPPLKEAYNLCQGIYPIEVFKKAEGFILEHLDWDLRVISPYQFIHHYLSKGCVFSSDETVFGEVDAEILGYMKKYSESFANLSMDDYEFNQFPSHIVACSAIASTRKLLGISPLWNPELEELTGTSWEMIQPCFDRLYSSFESSFPELQNFSQTICEKRENQKENKSQNYETEMMIELKETPLKKGGHKVVKDTESSRKRGLPANKKAYKIKSLSRLGKTNLTENKMRKMENAIDNNNNNKMNIEASNEFFDNNNNNNNNEKSGNIKRNLIY